MLASPAHETRVRTGPDADPEDERGLLDVIMMRPSRKRSEKMIALRAQGKALRIIAAEVQAKGHRISRHGVSDVLRAVGGA